MSGRVRISPTSARVAPTLLVLVLGLAGPQPPARAQVAFQPTVSSFPDGVMLGVTPVVSADRRYVRMGINPVFTGLQGFDSYSVPAAVGGLPAGLNGVGGGGAGIAGGGLSSVGLGMNPGFAGPASPEASAILSGRAGLPPAPSLSARAYPPEPTRRAIAKRPARPRKR